MTVLLIFRNKLPHFNSIENIFNTVTEYFDKTGNHKTEKIELPFYKLTALYLFKNIIILSKHKYEVTHITGDVHYTILFLDSKKTILTIHDCVTLKQHKKNSLKYLLVWLFWYKLPTLKAKYITVISEKTKQELINYTNVSESKIRVIPNFVNPAFFSLEKNDLVEETPIILQVGSASNKNLERVAQAIEGIDCILDIIGNLSDSQREILERMKIKFRNSSNLSNDVVIEKYKYCHLVIFASTYEGFGMPILEAQASQRPLITSHIEPMKSIAGPGAHYVNPFSTEDIRAGIIKVIEDSVYRESLIKAGNENVKAYTIEKVALQYLDLYKTVYRNSL